MTQNKNSGNVPHKTIDHNGNVINKPYGAGRWTAPRRYDCAHFECESQATLLSPGCPGEPHAHNCCAFHKEGAGQ